MIIKADDQTGSKPDADADRSDCRNVSEALEESSSLTKGKGIPLNTLEQRVKKTVIFAKWNEITEIKKHLKKLVHSLCSYLHPRKTEIQQIELDGIVNADVDKKDKVKKLEVRRRNRKRRRKSNHLKKAEPAVKKSLSAKEILKRKRPKINISSFLLVLISVLSIPTSKSDTSDNDICPGRQEAQLHVLGIVTCNVVRNSEEIYWYNETEETSGSAAFIQMVCGVIAGNGYDSGEFSVQRDGSLIINNVKRHHEGPFLVKRVDSNGIIDTYDILLSVSDTEICPERQEVKLHRRAIVHCKVVFNSEEVYWYQGEKTSARTAFIQRVNGVVSGIGYESGDYNVRSDGSLIIKNVTRHHECPFRVKTVDSRSMIKIYNLHLFVNDSPPPLNILVDECVNYRPCDLSVTNSLNIITCRIAVAHYGIHLIMEPLSENIILTRAINESFEENGVLFRTIKGEVMMVDNNCGKNGTVLCKAVELTSETPISDVHIILTDRNHTCPPRSATRHPHTQFDPGSSQHGHSHLTILSYILLSLFIFSILFAAAVVVMKRNHQLLPRSLSETNTNETRV